MDTKEIIGRIFKDPATRYELTEFENLGKPIHDILTIYPKVIATGREAGKTRYYLKSFIPFSTGNEEVQVYVEDGKTSPEIFVRRLWVYKIKSRYQFSYWDSLIIASALENGCIILFTEDLQHNQMIEETLWVKNPFF